MDIDPMFLLVVAMVVVGVVLVLSKGRNFLGPDLRRACRSCGAAHPSFARFCRRCGKRL